MVNRLGSVIIITGHYGSGKTNLAINLALDLQKQRGNVVLADLDIVNPYFRTADFVNLAAARGIELVKSEYANSSLDIPSLNVAIEAKMSSGATLIIDVGGDDAGATALGRYAPSIVTRPYDMLYVFSRYRFLTQTPKGAADILNEIEGASRLAVTALVNNTNLGEETTREAVLASLAYADETAKLCGRELLCTTMRRDFFETTPDKTGLHPIDVLVKTPWMM